MSKVILQRVGDGFYRDKQGRFDVVRSPDDNLWRVVQDGKVISPMPWISLQSVRNWLSLNFD